MGLPEKDIWSLIVNGQLSMVNANSKTGRIDNSLLTIHHSLFTI